MKGIIVILSMFLFISTLNAAVEIKQFSNTEQEQRYNHIIDELRCLVCQNQNISGSNAGLAQDLRKQVYKMIMAGEDDAAIFDFMVTRYGDFVLYRPPFKATTLFLWLGPFIILALGLFLLVRFIRQREKVVLAELNSADKEKLKKLLNENKEQS